METLEKNSQFLEADVSSHDFAIRMDSIDPLRSFRKRFSIPKRGGLPSGALRVNDKVRWLRIMIAKVLS